MFLKGLLNVFELFLKFSVAPARDLLTVPVANDENQLGDAVEAMCFDNNPSETSSTVQEISGSDTCRSDSSLMTLVAELKNVTLVLCSELSNGYQWADVASLSMDNVSVSCYPHLIKVAIFLSFYSVHECRLLLF